MPEDAVDLASAYAENTASSVAANHAAEAPAMTIRCCGRDTIVPSVRAGERIVFVCSVCGRGRSVRVVSRLVKAIDFNGKDTQ